MLQVATFLLPAEQDKANEFLKTHKPEGTINFNKDTIVVLASGPRGNLLSISRKAQSEFGTLAGIFGEFLRKLDDRRLYRPIQQVQFLKTLESALHIAT